MSQTSQFAQPSPKPRRLNRNQQQQLEWLNAYPRTIFGATVQVEERDGVWGEKHSCFFDLPEFVEPYFPILDKLKEIRLDAITTQNETSIGIIGLYLKRASRYIRGQPVCRTKSEFVDDYTGYLAMVLDLKPIVVKRAVQIVDEKTETLDPLVKSLFKQLEKARNEYVSPRLSFAFLSLRICTDCFSFFPFPFPALPSPTSSPLLGPFPTSTPSSVLPMPSSPTRPLPPPTSPPFFSPPPSPPTTAPPSPFATLRSAPSSPPERTNKRSRCTSSSVWRRRSFLRRRRRASLRRLSGSGGCRHGGLTA
jgi:hypothetical protein